MLTTNRLILRQWKQSDYEPFALMNADSRVMECFPHRLERVVSDEVVDKTRALIKKNGWGFWALELKETGEFIGFTGLHSPPAIPPSPCVEIGWRLAFDYWGQGLATEAARCALEFGFTELKLEEIVAFTAVPNLRSQALMLRLGMRNTENNFMHPAISSGHPLQEHVLYSINNHLRKEGA